MVSFYDSFKMQSSDLLVTTTQDALMSKTDGKLQKKEKYLSSEKRINQVKFNDPGLNKKRLNLSSTNKDSQKYFSNTILGAQNINSTVFSQTQFKLEPLKQQVLSGSQIKFNLNDAAKKPNQKRNTRDSKNNSEPRLMKGQKSISSDFN